MNPYEELKKSDPEIYGVIKDELRRQQEQLVLIASENTITPAGLAAQGSVLTNKYAEGYPGRRWYAGCLNVDRAEGIAIDRAKELFGVEHANVQPHCGTSANMAVYNVVLEPGDTILAMDLTHGGHLSHGHSKNFSGRTYKTIFYGVTRDTETIDYDALAELAHQCRPRLIVAGASSYPRAIDFERFAEITREVSAYLMADIAHIAGLIAAGVHASPAECADFITGTTHKTLRGTRGGFILCRKDYAGKVDEEVFPGIQGGPLMHSIAAKAVAFKEALTDDFKQYQRCVVENSAVLADAMARLDYRLVSGGTDNHMFLIDLTGKGISGVKAEASLATAGIVLNKNVIPFEPKSPFDPSGIRIGSPTITSRGMGPNEMKEIAVLIDRALTGDDGVLHQVERDVADLCARFPLYEGLMEAGPGGTAS